MSVAPEVCAVVVSYNTRDELLQCLGSLEAPAVPLEVIVVDNASRDGSADAVAQRFPAATLVRNDDNVGFARACNEALRLSRAPYVLLLNSDAEVKPGAVAAMRRLLESRPRVGAVGPRTVAPDGAVEVSFGPHLTPLREWRQRRLVRGVRARRPEALRRAAALSAAEHEPAWVSGACVLLRRRAIEQVGGFDEGFFLYEEDVDLCRRLRQAGWTILFTPAAEVVHHLGRSMEKAPERARLEYHRSHLRYYRKHNGRAAAAVLRGYLAASGLLGWLRAAVGHGPEAEAARRRQRDLLRLAWLGR